MKMIRFIAILLLFSLSANIDLFGNQDRKKAIKSRKEHQKASRVKKAQEKVLVEKTAQAHKEAENQAHNVPEIILQEHVVQNNNNDNIIILQNRDHAEQEQNQNDNFNDINNFNNISNINVVHQDQNENQGDEQDKDDADNCTICFGNLDNLLEIATLLCNTTNINNRHRFHKDCIAKWLAQNNKCPMCQTENPQFPHDENIPQLIKNRFDQLVIKNQEQQKAIYQMKIRKALKIGAASVVVGIGTQILYHMLYKNLCENGNLEYCSTEQLCTIWNNIEACTALCKNGTLEYCTKEQLCTIWHNMAACTELCKDGILKYCTKEQLCNIHNFWKHCPCSIEDLRGCLPALCKNLPYCPEVITWLAETFSTAPEALIKMFV